MKTAGIIGASNLDIVAAGAGPEVFTLRTMPVSAIEIHTGGDALNEATVLGSLNLRPHLYTLLGADEAGRKIAAHCRDHGIILHNLSQAYPTSMNVVLVEKDAQRCFLTTTQSAMRQLCLEQIPALEPDIICLASLFVSPQFPLKDAARWMKKLKSENKTTLVDTTTAKKGETLEDLKTLLPYVDYYLTNEREAASITHADVIQSMKQLIQAGANHVIIKQGSQGALVYDGKKIQSFPAHQAGKVVDTTGCGDCFAAGLIAGLMQEKSFAFCLEQALSFGARACERVGATAAFTGKTA